MSWSLRDAPMAMATFLTWAVKSSAMMSVLPSAVEIEETKTGLRVRLKYNRLDQNKERVFEVPQ